MYQNTYKNYQFLHNNSNVTKFFKDFKNCSFSSKGKTIEKKKIFLNVLFNELDFCFI